MFEIVVQDCKIKNIEFIKEILDNSLAAYRGMEVTEASIKQAKKDRAFLKGVVNSLEAKRKEVKNACLAPYYVFESQQKELVEMIDNPIREIELQTRAFEEKERNERMEILKRFFKENSDGINDLVYLEKIFNAKWLNKSFKIEDAFKEIRQIIERVKSDEKTIESLNHPYILQIKDSYYRILNLSAAIQDGDRLIEVAKHLEEQENRHKIKSRIAENMPSETTAIFGNPQSEEIEKLAFTVYVTESQKKALGHYLRENKIKYERI